MVARSQGGSPKGKQKATWGARLEKRKTGPTAPAFTQQPRGPPVNKRKRRRWGLLDNQAYNKTLLEEGTCYGGSSYARGLRVVIVGGQMVFRIGKPFPGGVKQPCFGLFVAKEEEEMGEIGSVPRLGGRVLSGWPF